jgi:hypothetical protein
VRTDPGTLRPRQRARDSKRWQPQSWGRYQPQQRRGEPKYPPAFFSFVGTFIQPVVEVVLTFVQPLVVEVVDTFIQPVEGLFLLQQAFFQPVCDAHATPTNTLVHFGDETSTFEHQKHSSFEFRDQLPAFLAEDRSPPLNRSRQSPRHYNGRPFHLAGAGQSSRDQTQSTFVDFAWE